MPETLSDRPAPIGVTVLSGFLGAGKTTLLKRLIENPEGERLAVLVNDFGAVNIDAALVESVASDQIALSNGCICCSIRDDLADAVVRLLDRDLRPDRILIEASGVSRPLAILEGLSREDIRDRITIEATLCLIDADQFPSLDYKSTELAIDQAVSSDLLILNKCDVARPADLAATEETLVSTMPEIRRIRTVFADVPREVLFGPQAAKGDGPAARAGSHRVGHAHDHGHDHDHGHTHAHVCDAHCDHAHHSHADEFESWSWTSDAVIDVEKLRRAVRDLPHGLLRAKGVLRGAGPTGDHQRVVFHLVGKRSSVTLEAGAAPEVSQLVAIGRRGEIAPAALQQVFEGCRGG